MKDEARQARLLAAFGALSRTNQDLVLKVSEVMQEAITVTIDNRGGRPASHSNDATYYRARPVGRF